MKKLINGITKTFRNLGTVAALLMTSCTNCPKETIDSIMSAIPDAESKNNGFDLKGWRYKKVTSPASNETYYYYHMASIKPDAPKFVLVHGMFLDGRTFLNFGKLAENFELIALELPHNSIYYGGNKKDFPKLLQAFLDALDIKQMYLGGVSLGGQIAMFYMTQDPKTQVDGLALISTDMPKDEKALKKAKRLALTALKATQDNDEKMVCLVNKLAERKKKQATPEDEEVMKIFSLKRPSFYREVLYTSITMDEVTPINTIDVPTVVIHGTEDSTIPFDSAKHLVDYIPNSKLHVLEGGEHAMVYTRADEVVTVLQESFVN